MKYSNILLIFISNSNNREAGISAVVFHPNNDIAVSTSHGGDFKVCTLFYRQSIYLYRNVTYDSIFMTIKVWVHSTSKQKQFVQKYGWRCQSIGSYKYEFLSESSDYYYLFDIHMTWWWLQNSNYYGLLFENFNFFMDFVDGLIVLNCHVGKNLFQLLLFLLMVLF